MPAPLPITSLPLPRFPPATSLSFPLLPPYPRRRFSLCSAVAQLRVAIAGGGSGGHVTPAIAIAEELAAAAPGTVVIFLGSSSGIEARLVPASGHEIRLVPTVPLARPFLSFPNLLLLPFRLIAASLSCWNVFREFRPDVVIGTGGYVSVPACLAAAAMRVDVVIQEQNCSPGVANGLIGWFARRIFVGFEGGVEGFGRNKERCVVSGNPIRAGLRRFVSKAVARSHFFPRAKGEAQVVLLLGGSAGASSINVAVLNMYSRMLKRCGNRLIIWQTGEDGFSEMESLVRSSPRVVLTPFIMKMDLAYAAADVVVSRAGAMTCSEILATGKPSILIPSSTVADDYQEKNAQYMAELAGSKVIVENELDPSTLEDAIDEVLGIEEIIAEMSQKALSNAKPDASREIVQEVLSLVKTTAKKGSGLVQE